MAERCSQTFFSNLSLSQRKENEFASLLQSKGWNTTTTQSKGSFKDYDVQATSGTTTITFEVKYDHQSSITGNVAVEHYNNDGGIPKPSGLSATKAQWYVYAFPGDSNFYLISTNKLKRMIKNKEWWKETIGGNGHYFNLKLFTKEYFIKNCKVISAFE